MLALTLVLCLVSNPKDCFKIHFIPVASQVWQCQQFGEMFAAHYVAAYPDYKLDKINCFSSPTPPNDG